MITYNEHFHTVNVQYLNKLASGYIVNHTDEGVHPARGREGGRMLAEFLSV